MKRFFLFVLLASSYSVHAENNWWDKTKEQFQRAYESVKRSSQRAIDWVKDLFKKEKSEPATPQPAPTPEKTY